jgi:RHS repeat-associated protein
LSSNAIYTDTYSYTGPDQTDRVQANNTSYTYGSLGLGSATTSGSSVYYTRDSSGKLISERTPTGTYYYLTNNIGSVILVTDSTGKVQNSYSYDPLGNSLGKTENVANPWQFAGGYLDATTGLYKFGTRYYNPTVGRWTQPDPKGGNITDINSLARYAYADDDPVNVTDPSGRGQGECLIAILNVIGQLLAFAWVIGLIAQALLLLIADPVTLIAAFFLLIVYGGTAAVAVVLTVWNLEIAPACGLPVVKVNGF